METKRIQHWLKENWFKLGLLFVIVGYFLYDYPVALNRSYQQKTQCVAAGEQYYANYLKEQEHNPMFSFEVNDMSHEVAYSSKLNTCLLYVDIKFKDFGGKIGNDMNKFIFDISNNKFLYSMSYGLNNGEVVVLKTASSFPTNKEFFDKKDEIFK